MGTFPLTQAQLGSRLCAAVDSGLATPDNPVAICFVGSDGTVWSSRRQDGTDRISVASAELKAKTALEWGKDTHELEGVNEGDARATGKPFTTRPGGHYIVSSSGEELGAVGISTRDGVGARELVEKVVRQVLDAVE